MEKLLEIYKNKKPEIIFEWNDAESEARGWVVINSLRNGAAGGGTRMRKGLTREEVISLAKVMEIKFSVSGPDIGGAKSGIDFDPADPRRQEVLRRWYRAVFPLLKNYYGTGGDLNVDELKDVIPITEELGLWHPQEGIVNGHLQSTKGGLVSVLGQLRYGTAKIIEDPAYTPGQKKLAIADMVTGFGVAKAVEHYYKIFHDQPVKGKRTIIQGWGNVASAAGYYLSQAGASIVGIIDRQGGVLAPDGLSFNQVSRLFLDKQGNRLHALGELPFEEVDKHIWDIGAEIFIPGAASKLVTPKQVNAMIAGGLEAVSCGANVPFIDDTIFFGPTATYTDQKVALLPDFIANCGMARVFAYLMQPNAAMTDQAIFEDISKTIKSALLEVCAINSSGKGIATTALQIALANLMPKEEWPKLLQSIK